MITKERIAASIDHMVIGTYHSRDEVIKACDEAISHGFNGIYVNPSYVKTAKEHTAGRCAVGTVIGYPWGAHTTACKIFESLEAIDNGADELDLLINVSKLKAGDDGYVLNELSDWVKACKERKSDVVCKVTIECWFLTHEEKKKAVELACQAGCDQIKQSTGTTLNSNYTLGDVMIIYKTAAGRAKVCASGWLMNVEDAIAVLEAGCDRIDCTTGPGWIDRDYDNNRYYG